MCVKGVVFAIFLQVAAVASAQPWAEKMFDGHTAYDFGVVARGAKVEHSFVMENIFEENVHIASVRSSCGCTTPQISKNFLKTWEKGEITAVIDTRGFLGRKDATMTVTIDQPFPAEVQLHVHVFIRSDVVIQPGAVQFGNVAQGTTYQQKASVSYAGRDDWRIERVESGSPYLSARVTETGRVPGQVNYDLIVTLQANAPGGYLQENLMLVTNDYAASSARVPVPVEGIIETAMTVRPAPLLLGIVETGQSATRSLVIQGRSPFRIVTVRSSDARFTANVSPEARTLHVLPVTFLADSTTGAASAVLQIETDRPGTRALEAPVQAQVVAGTASEIGSTKSETSLKSEWRNSLKAK